MKSWNQIRPSLALSFSALSAILVITSCAPKDNLNPQTQSGSGLAVPAADVQGGQDAGGGDVPKTESAHILSAVLKVKNDAISFLASIRDTVARPTFKSDDVELEQVFNAFFGQADRFGRRSRESNFYPVADMIKDSPKPLLSSSAACRDRHGESHDAATRFKPGSQVCIDAKSLQRLSPDSVRDELLALYFHELTHQMGFGESAAIKVQNFVREKRKSAYMIWDLRILATYAFRASSTSQRCFVSGQIEGEISNWQGRVLDIDFSALPLKTRESRWFKSLGAQIRPNMTGRAGGIMSAIAAELCDTNFASNDDKTAFLDLVNYTLDSI